MPFPPKPSMQGPTRSNPPSFTLSPSIEFSSDEELDDLLEPARKKHKAAKPDVPKCVQFHPCVTVVRLMYAEVPGSKPWKLVPIRQRADEDGILYPKYWAKLAHHKTTHKLCLRSFVEQGCNCRKDKEGKDSVCFYCARVHSAVMVKNHLRDEDDLGMKLTTVSPLCDALDLRGLPPAAPKHARKRGPGFFS